MKAEPAQQRLLLELAELDAELGRLDHRAAHLPERDEHERIRGEQIAAEDRLGAVRIALEDLDAESTRFESDIDGVRRREDRDRDLLDSGAADAKALTDLQHELGTLQRRRADLEDSLLAVLERREELEAQATAETAVLDGLAADLAGVQQTLDSTIAEIEQTRADRGVRRADLIAELDPELTARYERQRDRAGVGAGRLQGARCGACRIEIDRGELARISAAAADEVVVCPECGAILLRVVGS